MPDRISVIDHGRAVADGTPDELKSHTGGDRLEVVAVFAPLAVRRYRRLSR